MSTKIESNGGAAQTYGPTMEQLEGDAKVEGPAAAKAQKTDEMESAGESYDAWDFEQTYADYMPKKEQSGPTMEAARQESAGFSAWEAQSAAAIGDSAPTVTNNTANPIAAEFSDALERGSLDAKGLADGEFSYGSGLSQPLLDNLGRGQLLTGLSDTQKLRSELAAELKKAPGGAELSQEQIGKILDDVVASCEGRVAQGIQTGIEAQIEVTLRDTQGFMDGAAANARGVAIKIAEETSDPATISEQLKGFGVHPDAADDIASELAVIAKDPQKLATFKAGKEGDAEYFTAGDSWKDVDKDLAEAFRETSADIAQLQTRVSNDSYKNARILNSDLYELPRDAALDGMREELDPAQLKAFERIVGEAKTEGEAADTREAVIKSAITIAAAAVSGGVGMGAAAGLGMGAAGSAEAINTAFGDVDAARVANRQGMTDDDAIRKAEDNFHVEVAFAALGVALGVNGIRAERAAAEAQTLRHAVPVYADQVEDAVKEGIGAAAQELGKAGVSEAVDFINERL